MNSYVDWIEVLNRFGFAVVIALMFMGLFGWGFKRLLNALITLMNNHFETLFNRLLDKLEELSEEHTEIIKILKDIKKK